MKSTDVILAQGPLGRGKLGGAKRSRRDRQRASERHTPKGELGCNTQNWACLAKHARQGCARRGESDESQRIEEENRRRRELRRRLGGNPQSLRRRDLCR